MKNTLLLVFLLPFLACTNSVNSNDPETKQEQTTATEKSVNLENAVGIYKNQGRNPVGGYSRDCGSSQSLEIFELTNNIYRCVLRPGFINPLKNQSHCEITLHMSKIENGKWLANEGGWYIVVPNKGFQEDLPSIVLAYEDSTGRVQAYPFYKEK